MADPQNPGSSILQPFRRNLNVDPISIPVGLTGVATAVPAMTGGGVTSFKMCNPTPLWVWYRGWQGTAADMPTIPEKGHFIAPGAMDICRTQMPQWIAAVAANEFAAPALDGSGNFLYTGKNLRLVMVYGSGA